MKDLKFKVDQGFYHVEYTTLHNDRMQLLRIIHQWRQIGFPSAIICYTYMANLAAEINSYIILVCGWLISIIVILWTWVITIKHDKGITRIYARLIYLEKVLDFHFYHDYLKRRYEDLIMAVEDMDNYESIKAILEPDRFGWAKRSGGPWLYAKNLIAFLATIASLIIWHLCLVSQPI